MEKKVVNFSEETKKTVFREGLVFLTDPRNAIAHNGIGLGAGGATHICHEPHSLLFFRHFPTRQCPACAKPKLEAGVSRIV